MPPLILDTALSYIDLELYLGLFDIEVLLAIEDREVLAYNLIAFIPLKQLGALVLGRNIALYIEEEDGIVFDPLYEDIERLVHRKA